MPSIGIAAIGSGHGVTVAVPTLVWASYGNFTITNYDATHIYTLVGGTRVGNVFSVTAATGNGTISAKPAKGTVASAVRTVYRQARTSHLEGGVGFHTHFCADCSCGGTYYPPGGWGPGEPGGCYTVHDHSYSVDDSYAGAGYTDAGSEWWKTV